MTLCILWHLNIKKKKTTKIRKENKGIAEKKTKEIADNEFEHLLAATYTPPPKSVHNFCARLGSKKVKKNDDGNDENDDISFILTCIVLNECVALATR